MLRSPLNDAPSHGGEARWHSLYSSAQTSLSEYLNRGSGGYRMPLAAATTPTD
jgi:hypothetical protein